MQKLLTFFQQKYLVYAIFNDQSFNYILTNDIVSVEQLGPDICSPVISDSVSEMWMPWSDCTDVQTILGLCCPHMPKDMFKQGAAIWQPYNSSLTLSMLDEKN